MGLDNENPTLFEKSEERKVSEKELDDYEVEEFDSREIFGKLFLLLKHNALNFKNNSIDLY